MGDWKEYKFSDFVDISPTVSLKGGVEYSFIEMKDLQDGNKYCFPNTKRKLSGGARFIEGDTLFARITPCLENGKICMVKGLENGVGFGSTEFLIFRGKENISDNEFVFYLSRWDEVRGFAESNFEGTSGRQRVPKNCFDNLHLDLPLLPEQNTIATILSSLDDKIDLLHRQNKTLEQLAETLFRQWFVEEADESKRTIRLGEIMEIKHGYAFKGENITTDEMDKILLTPGNFRIGGGFKEEKFRYYNSEDFPKEYILEEDALVITMTDLSQEGDTLGYPAIIPYIRNKRLLHNQRIGKVIFKAGYLSWKYFVYFLLTTDEYRSYVLGSATGTTVRHTSPNRICDFEFIKPAPEALSSFNASTKSIFEKIKLNQKQIRTLTQLRDTLLPKLMSGEVRVNQAP